jgi:hypothetical protein
MLRILTLIVLAGLFLTGCGTTTATTTPPAANTTKLTMTVYKDAP